MRAPSVVILAYPELCTFEFGIAVELFAMRRDEEPLWYDCDIASEQPGHVTATGGVRIEITKGLDTVETLSRGDLVVVPGWTLRPDSVSERLALALASAHERGVRLMSICSGAFALAEAGLLRGRAATTHWRYTELFASRYGDMGVRPNVLFVEDDGIFTSAGSAAGLDLGLHIIAEDFGVEVSNRVAKRLVLPRRREGGQRQYETRRRAVETPTQPQPLARLMETVERDLRAPWTVESLAEAASLSQRTLARRFRDELDCTPLGWIRRRRLDEARRLLEVTDKAIAEIAHDSGFGSEESLRLHFRRAFGVPPTRYRQSFSYA